jgi:hypothetical protein
LQKFSEMLRVQKFLGCFDLQAGGLFIAGLNIVGSIVALLVIFVNSMCFGGELIFLFKV